jgi:hypothetical protein
LLRAQQVLGEEAELCPLPKTTAAKKAAAVTRVTKVRSRSQRSSRMSSSR